MKQTRSLIVIDPVDARPLYRQIMDEIRRCVVLGILKLDEALPSVRDLSVELGVNPSTVQQAYQALEREGVVSVRRGLGTFVTGIQPSEAERHRLAQAVAEGALREAYRHGLTLDELIGALKSAVA